MRPVILLSPFLLSHDVPAERVEYNNTGAECNGGPDVQTGGQQVWPDLSANLAWPQPQATVFTSAGSVGTSVCRRNQHVAPGRFPAARGTPPDGGSALPQRAAAIWRRWAWCSGRSRAPAEGDRPRRVLATAAVAAGKLWATAHLAGQVLHQRDHGVFEERRRRQRPFGDLGDAQFALGPHDLHHGVRTGCGANPTEFKRVTESETFPLFSVTQSDTASDQTPRLQETDWLHLKLKVYFTYVCVCFTCYIRVSWNPGTECLCSCRWSPPPNTCEKREAAQARAASRRLKRAILVPVVKVLFPQHWVINQSLITTTVVLKLHSKRLCYVQIKTKDKTQEQDVDSKSNSSYDTS